MKIDETGFKHYSAFFTGVVEDINDPAEMGRVRVRCFGYHTELKSELPTDALPWSHVMMPITSASISGVGQSPTGVKQGSWVVGFFRDGAGLQDPFILGTLPSASTEYPNSKNGFSDPSTEYPRNDFVDTDEVDNPRPARSIHSEYEPYTSKNANRQESVDTATPPRVTTIAPDKADAYYKEQKWSNHPLTEMIAPEYPHNHVHESSSGHIIEVDDTAGKERLSRFHKSGTYEEIVASGDRMITVVGDEYEVTLGSKNMLVKGAVNLTIDGDMRTLVKGNYHLEVEGSKTEYIKGERISKVGQNELLEIDQEYSLNVSENYSERIGGDEKRILQGNLDTNIAGSSTTTTVGARSTTLMGLDSETIVGDRTIGCTGNLTITCTGTMKIDTEADLDIDAVSNIVMTTPANIDVDGARIDLN